ncbi:MAG: hypothetical protein IID45_13260 [Planctomycetes bacterium]|nr:hypothetical protein [Planctomycetota bacterium]
MVAASLNGSGTFTANHFFVGNPSAANPAADIVMTVELTDDDGQSVTQEVTAIVPGEGLNTVAIDTTPPIPQLAVPPIAIVEVVEEPPPPVLATQSAELQSNLSGPTLTGREQIVIQVVYPDGTLGEDIELGDEDTDLNEVLNDLPKLFKSLPDDHYRLSLIRADGTRRLILNVVLRQNKPEDRDATSQPASNDDGDRPKSQVPNREDSRMSDEGGPVIPPQSNAVLPIQRIERPDGTLQESAAADDRVEFPSRSTGGAVQAVLPASERDAVPVPGEPMSIDAEEDAGRRVGGFIPPVLVAAAAATWVGQTAHERWKKQVDSAMACRSRRRWVRTD